MGAATADLEGKVKTLTNLAEAQGKQIETMTKNFSTVMDRLAKTPANGLSERNIFGLPNIRHGEDPMSSRGFSFMKLLGLLTRAVTPDQAKVEMDVHNRLAGCFQKSADQYNFSGRPGETGFLAPLSSSYFDQEVVPRDFRREMKSLVQAGSDEADPDEMAWIRQQRFKSLGYSTKDLSWLNEALGGALVKPPEQGELIELLRNKEALVNAGARTIPLPPQGRLKLPRQTAASLTYWVGENAGITASDIGTGEVTMQAKKLTVLIKMPNELIRFASPAAEALVRDDMTKSLALALDLAGIEGSGGDNKPRGLINMPLINSVTAKSTTADGDKISPEDFYRMIAAVEESNAEFEGWVMRPKTLYKVYQLRSDAVAQGDGQGLFLFSMIREAGEGIKPNIAGHPVTKSTQISQVRAKGTSSNLTMILGGMWSDLLIGMFGAIEFAATTLGDTPFQNDQTWVRGILSADIAARHESAFVWMDNLSTSL